MNWRETRSRSSWDVVGGHGGDMRCLKETLVIATIKGYHRVSPFAFLTRRRRWVVSLSTDCLFDFHLSAMQRLNPKKKKKRLRQAIKTSITLWTVT
ncbi:hypothetical protein LZ32DRAFT_462240 [Colletotrichum eremochloae]|nr:hypothetical protein LZ32DRAFT_462240 [Colletotrichum eremochloae]